MPWSTIRVVGRPSLSSFIAGAVFATAFVGVPAIAAVVNSDQNPTVYDGTTPSLTVQPAKFYVGTSIGAATNFCGGPYGYNSVPMKLSWDAIDSPAGVASFDVYEAGNGGEAGTNLLLDHTTSTTTDVVTFSYDGACGGGYEDDLFWVTARDFRGATATSPMISSGLTVYDDTGYSDLEGIDSLATTKTGTWSTSTCKCANFGSTSYTTAKNASITYTINVGRPGRTLAIVAPTSSNRGVMNISVDGATAEAVNTYATTTTNRVIAWQKTLNAGTHTIKVTNAGTAGHGRIDVDTLLLGPAWGGEVSLWLYSNG